MHPTMTASNKLKPARRMIRDPRPVMHDYSARLWCRSMRPDAWNKRFMQHRGLISGSMHFKMNGVKNAP